MSRITLSGNASGTGTFTIAAPNSNTDRTLTLPDAAGTVVTDTATQTLTNKTIQGGALTLGTAQNSTSGTSIDFTGIPSWARRVTVMFSGVSTNGTSNYQVQIGAGSFTTSGYTSGSSYASAGGITSTSTSAGFALLGGATTAAGVFSGSLVLTVVAGNTWSCSFNGFYTGGTFWGGGSLALSGTLDRVRITTVNGTDTFDAGTINIMWEG